jgi:osmotically-inducible protein OsmY
MLLFPSCDQYIENPVPTPVAPTTTPVPTKAPVLSKKESPPKSNKAEKQAPMTDQMITQAVEEKLHRDPVVSYDHVDLSVVKGVVTFSGTSDNLLAKERANRLVETVRGVRSVVNNIEVMPSERIYDAKIYQDTKTAFALSASPDLIEMVDVAVKDGRAVLDGKVDSWQEQRVAVSRAKSVRGVKAVDDKVVVEVKETRPDEEIKEAVEDTLLLDPRVPKEKVRLSVENGKVRLTGKVYGIQAKRAAERDARRTLGVHCVENRLRVKPPSEISDAAVEENIRDALRLDPYIVDESTITVSVRNGIVRLEGEATSLFEKMRADVAAAGIRGVAHVMNRLQVRDASDPLVFDPYLGDWYTHDFGRYEKEPRCKALDDRVIQHRIDRNLVWSPYVSEIDVDVSVELGAATLEGEVKTWAERRAAVRAALNGGAQQMINKVTVADQG